MNLLWAFNFGLAKDDAGKPIPIDLNDMTDVSLSLLLQVVLHDADYVVSGPPPHSESV